MFPSISFQPVGIFRKSQLRDLNKYNHGELTANQKHE